MEKMQAVLLDLNEAIQHTNVTVLKTALSFGPFIDFLEKSAEEVEPLKASIARSALQLFSKYPELRGRLPVADISRYPDVLEQVHALLTPALPAGKEEIWALSLPASPHIFYGTASFYNLMTEPATGKIKDNILSYSAELWKEKRLTNIYAVILQKLYGFSMDHKEIVHEITDDKTGLTSYYRFNFDTRFLTIKSNTPLPEITVELLQEQLAQQVSPVQILETILPLHHFSFEGFSVFTLTDITTEYILNRLKDISMPQEGCSDKSYTTHIERALKTIAGSNEVHFGLLPFLRINDKIVFNEDISYQSLLIRIGKKQNLEEALFLHFAENYIQHPRLFFFRSLSAAGSGNNLLEELLIKEGIGSYMAVPLQTRGQVVGVMEIYATSPGTIDEKMLSKLNVAETLLAQLVQYTIDAIKEEIGHVINEKFTPLQQSVAWKFREAAWQYISAGHQGEDAALPPVVFQNVFPLYGAIDVRNSTVERNNALKADLATHASILMDTLLPLKKYTDPKTFTTIKERCDEWSDIVEYKISPYQSFRVEDYLYKEVVPFLLTIRQQYPDTAAGINHYLQAIDEKTGITWLNRRNLEASLQLINTSVGESLNQFNRHLQESFPCYFDKFRTDGIEYDVYAGSSIAPGKTLTREILKDMRKKQLSVMALIARQAKELLPRLSMPLQTTQLIFVHSTPIDIAFRTDERRFDVEGGYNIRYQVVKKRIDKAFIKNSSQRLTQPGTIAIVYFEQMDVEDYLDAIPGLQEAQVLLPDLEWLELEDLQGVSGLKALRLFIKE